MAVRADQGTDLEGNSAPVRIFLLGGFRVERDGVTIADSAWGRPQAKTLIKLLAVEPSHRLHRDQIADTLWPDQLPARGTANLRKLVYFARHAVEQERTAQWRAEWLEVRDDVFTLVPASVWIDTDAFKTAAGEALRAVSPNRLEASLALYTGELLPEDRYEPWTEPCRAALAAFRLDLLLALGRALGAKGARDAGIRRLHELLALDPVHEAAHRELMRLQVAAGNRREALRQYDRCREVLAEHLGAEPEEETEALFQTIRDRGGGARSLLPPAALDGSPSPLIGRARALALLLDNPLFAPERETTSGASMHLDAATRRPLVFLHGEAGVGKTRLAAEVARIAAGRGAAVLWGACYRQIAYGPFAEALEQYAASLPRAERAALASSHPELARVLPSLALAGPPAPGDPAGDQLRLYAAIGRFLAHVSKTVPLLMVLDDVHLADAASLHLLVYLARLAPRQPWLLLCTYREEDVPFHGELEAVMAELQRTGASRRLELLRLSRRESDLLVDQVLPGEVREAVREHVFRISLGNPLFAVELMEGLRASGDLLPSEGGWTLRPEVADHPLLPAGSKVADLISARVRSLDEPTRRVLAVLAAGGMELPAPVLLSAAERAGLQTEETLQGIERGMAVHVLEERDQSYAFGHPLFRETIYAQLAQVRRASVHAAVAQAIEVVQPQAVEALAYHYDRSGKRAKQIEYLERAGDHASSIYANALAESYYRRLLAVLTAGDPAVPRVQSKLGQVLNVLARHNEALELFEAAAGAFDLLGAEDELGRAVAAIGLAHAARGTPEAAIERLEGTIRSLDGVAHEITLAELSMALGHVYYACSRYAESLAAAERAERLSRPLRRGREALRIHAQAEVRRAAALTLLGRGEEARRVLEAALPEVEAAEDLDNLARVVNNLAYAAQLDGQFQEHQRYQQRSLEIAERLGDPARIAVYRAALGQATFFTNDWNMPDSLALAEEGYRELRELGPSWHTAYAGLYLGWILHALGRWEEARQVLEESVAAAGNDRQVLIVLQGLLADIDLHDGRPEAARARLEPLLVHDEEGDDLDSTLARAYLARVAFRLGDRERALALSERAVRRARQVGYPIYLLEALLARGVVHLMHGAHDHAEAELIEGLTVSRRVGYGAREAMFLLMLGCLETMRGNVSAARRLCGEGRELTVRLGGDSAARFADLCLQEFALPSGSVG